METKFQFLCLNNYVILYVQDEMKVMERKQVVYEQLLEDQKLNHQYLVKDTKLEVTSQIEECQSNLDSKMVKLKCETEKVRMIPDSIDIFPDAAFSKMDI